MILLGVIAGTGIGAFFGIIIGILWAKLDGRRPVIPPYQEQASWGQMRSEPAVKWREQN